MLGGIGFRICVESNPLMWFWPSSAEDFAGGGRGGNVEVFQCNATKLNVRGKGNE